MKKIVTFPVLILTFLVAIGCSPTAPEFSTFNVNDDGWVVEGDLRSLIREIFSACDLKYINFLTDIVRHTTLSK